MTVLVTVLVVEVQFYLCNAAGSGTHCGECLQSGAQLEGCQGGAGVGGAAALPGACAP